MAYSVNLTIEQALTAKRFRKAFNETHGIGNFLPEVPFEELNPERQAEWYQYSQSDYDPETRKLLREKYGFEIPQSEKDKDGKYEEQSV